MPTIRPGIAHTGKKDVREIAFVKCLLWVVIHALSLLLQQSILEMEKLRLNKVT